MSNLSCAGCCNNDFGYHKSQVQLLHQCLPEGHSCRCPCLSHLMTGGKCSDFCALDTKNTGVITVHRDNVRTTAATTNYPSLAPKLLVFYSSKVPWGLWRRYCGSCWHCLSWVCARGESKDSHVSSCHFLQPSKLRQFILFLC